MPTTEAIECEHCDHIFPAGVWRTHFIAHAFHCSQSKLAPAKYGMQSLLALGAIIGGLNDSLLESAESMARNACKGQDGAKAQAEIANVYNFLDNIKDSWA